MQYAINLWGNKQLGNRKSGWSLQKFVRLVAVFLVKYAFLSFLSQFIKCFDSSNIRAINHYNFLYMWVNARIWNFSPRNSLTRGFLFYSIPHKGYRRINFYITRGEIDTGEMCFDATFITLINKQSLEFIVW